MEIAFISPATIRIKSKQALFFIDPSHQKTTQESDAAVFLTIPSDVISEPYTTGITLFGPGEFEIKGVKITGVKSDNDLYYIFSADGIETLVGKATTLFRAKEKLHECQIAVVLADEVLNQQVVGILNAGVLALYGNKAGETLVGIGKENIAPTGKYTVTKEKLPAETEFILLE